MVTSHGHVIVVAVVVVLLLLLLFVVFFGGGGYPTGNGSCSKPSGKAFTSNNPEEGLDTRPG